MDVTPFTNFLKSQGRHQPSTIKVYSKSLASLSQFKEQSIRDFLRNEAKCGVGPNTIRRHLSAMRSYANFADKQSEVIHLDSPKKQRPLPHVLSKQDVQTLINAAQSLRDRAALSLLYYSGIRASELTALKRQDITPQTRVNGKTGPRLVLVNSIALAACNAYWAEANTHPQDSAFKISRVTLWAIAKRAFAKSGLNKHVSPHVLRHSFATHLLEGKDAMEGLTVNLNPVRMDIRKVQLLLGHRDISTTSIYLHCDRKQLKRTHALLGR